MRIPPPPHMLKIGRKNLHLFTEIQVYNRSTKLQCFSFLMGGKDVMLLSLFDSIWKFSGKSHKYMCLKLIPIRIRRIRKKDADSTRSGSTTLVY
jgi:hypothetical protein